MSLLTLLRRKGASFGPMSLSGLVVWYKPSILNLNDGDPVSSLNDLSGGGWTLTQGTPANRPTYQVAEVGTLAAVQGDGGDSLANAGFNALSGVAAMTLFVLMKGNTTGNQVHVDFGSEIWFQLAPSDATAAVQSAIDAGLGFGYRPNLTSGAPTIYEVQFNGGGVDNASRLVIRINGWTPTLTFSGTIPATLTPVNGVTLCNLGGGGFGSTAPIAEVFAHTAIHSADNGKSLRRYLAQRAGIARLLAFDGDSMTLGTGVIASNYPNVVNSSLGYGATTHINAAVTDARLTNLNSDAATELDPLLGVFRDNVCVVWGGTNDLYDGDSAATVEGRLQTYCAARQAAGWKVVVLTILPRSDVGVSPNFNANRATLNTWIRANYASWANALADVAADTNIGDDGDELDGTYYQADKVHMTATGYALVASIVTTAIQSL